jgi:dienelactone hydrolase
VDGFGERRFVDGRFAHTVFKGGSGPPVIVLHEMAGLSPGAVAFARRLIGAGFTVHLPLFFGRPEQAGTTRSVRRNASTPSAGASEPSSTACLNSRSTTRCAHRFPAPPTRS